MGSFKYFKKPRELSGKVISPRLQKLENDFLQNGGKWKGINLGELFIIKNNPQLDKRHFVFTDNNGYPYFTRTVLNNGISGYVKYLDEEHKISGNSIAVGMLGMQFFYMKEDFYSGQFTKTIFPKFDYFNEKIALYFISILNKNRINFQSVLVRDFEKTFNELEVLIPYKNNEIDFPYMEKYIKEVELEHTEELKQEHDRIINAYLKTVGLKDYRLTKNDETILKEFDRLNSDNTIHRGGVKQIYKIGELFDIRPTKAYKKINFELFEDGGKNPVVTNSSLNNGIAGYSNLPTTEKANMITYSDTTTSDGIFYQPYDFIGYSHVQGLYPFNNDIKWDSKTLMYFVVLFRKSSKGRFDYGNKFNRKIAKELPVELPMKNSYIDFEFMYDFIKVVEKLVIKDVVLELDKKLQITKDFIDRV